MNLAAHQVPLDASKSMNVKTKGLAETAEGRLNLTTNLEGCHREGKEVSPSPPPSGHLRLILREQKNPATKESYRVYIGTSSLKPTFMPIKTMA
jgi:hypothetical protein